MKINSQILFLSKYLNGILGLEFSNTKSLLKRKKLTCEFFINYLIDRKEKSEILFKYIEITESQNEINYKKFIKNILEVDINSNTLIKMLKFYPDEIEKCINYYILTNNLKLACNVYSMTGIKNEDILVKLDIFSKRKFAFKLVIEMKQQYIDIVKGSEFFLNDELILNYFLKKSLENKLFEEVLYIIIGDIFKNKENGKPGILNIKLLKYCKNVNIINLLNFIIIRILIRNSIKIKEQQENNEINEENNDDELSFNTESYSNDIIKINNKNLIDLSKKIIWIKNKLNIEKNIDQKIPLFTADSSTNYKSEQDKSDLLNRINNISYEKLNYLSIFDILDLKINENILQDDIFEELNNIFNIIKLNFSDHFNLIYSDNFSPSQNSEDYFKIPLPEENIIFIDNLNQFYIVKEKFKESKFLGIDTEWKISNINLKECITSTIQISDKKNCFIFDYLKLKDEKNFMRNFSETFKDKIFLAFAFSSDLKTLGNSEINEFFKKEKIIDFKDVFTDKAFGTKFRGLSNMSLNLIGKKLCKKNQISNWELRPLRKEQIHYAALDAYILIEIFEKIINDDKYKELIKI